MAITAAGSLDGIGRAFARTASARQLAFGALAFGALLGAYFAALTAVSGWAFTAQQFSEFWYYIVPLAAGFGVQVALFVRLRQAIRGSAGSGSMLAASGTTSTAAMVSCCAHYLVNVAPVLGATGLVAFAAQFQVQLFWVGLAFNAAGIAFVGNRLLKASKAHETAADPVCGMNVASGRAAGSHDCQGRTYYFCSRHCLEQFKTDPDRYITQRKEQS